MIGKWNTFNDKNGDMASLVQISESNGVYTCVIQSLYQKKTDGTFEVKQPPYSKEDAKTVGSQIFIDMKEHRVNLKAKSTIPTKERPIFAR